MQINRILSSQTSLSPVAEKAAVPDQGTAASSCSTGNYLMYRKTDFSDIFQHQPWCAKGGDLYNLLQKYHYFSASLAKHPVSLVIIIEGIIKPFYSRG